MSLLRYKIAPRYPLPVSLHHSGVGRDPEVAGPVRSYNPILTYPCQGGKLAGGRTHGDARTRQPPGGPLYSAHTLDSRKPRVFTYIDAELLAPYSTPMTVYQV